MESIVQLRSLLSERPSSNGFSKLLKLFSHWEGTTSIDTGLAYAQTHLETWPDSVKEVDYKHVWPDFPDGPPLPSIALVRSLRFETTTYHHGRIPSEWLDEKGMQTLLESPQVQHLTGLHLRGHPLQDPSHTADPSTRNRLLELLSYTKALPKLERLILAGSYLDDSGMQIFAQSPLLQRLTSLTMRSCDRALFVREDGWKALARSKAIGNLKKLDLINCRILESAVEFGRSSELSSIEQFAISSSPAGPAFIKEIAANPAFRNLRSIRLFRCSLNSESLRPLVHSTHFEHLVDLGLPHNFIGDDGLILLSQLKSFSQLQTLDLSGCNITGKGLDAISCKQLPELKELCLARNDLGQRGMFALSKLAGLEQLQTLLLGECGISDDGFAHFIKTKPTSDLSTLSLYNNDIGDKGAIALANDAQMPMLEELELSNNNIGDQGATELAHNASFPALKTLQLNGNRMSTKGTYALCKSKRFPELENLLLYSSQVDDKGLTALAQSSHFTKLRELDITRGAIGDKGITALANAEQLHRLTDLRLNDNKFGDEGLIAFAASAHFPQLRELCLNGQNTTDESAIAFAQSPNFPQLRTLELHSAEIGDRGHKALVLSTHLHRSIRERYFYKLSEDALRQLAQEHGIDLQGELDKYALQRETKKIIPGFGNKS